MVDEQKFYSLEQVAEMLQVTYQMVYCMVRKGELPACRIGKLYRVMESDFQAFLEKRRINVSEPLVCSRCGKRYASKLSLVGSCRVCGSPLCKACVEIEHWNLCEVHQAEEQTNQDNTQKA